MKESTAIADEVTESGYFIDGYLAYLLSQASHAVSSEFRACLAAADVSVFEWRVLSTLYDHPQMSVGRLSDIVICKQPTLSKAIDRMEAKGWLTRALSRQDRRMIAVTIDDAGMEVIRPLIAKACDLEDAALHGISSAEIEHLKKSLRNLVRHCSDKRVLDRIGEDD